ncbi:hypothetical protein QT381_02740 [Galbitalea sp. SE-J8]|uniref:hypothetical protein n=1 Tax=Galbitalea sp. SE-J8 TaxID=3054952 RepID=UPI00259C8DBC|nr:hypothetical protein [Galbitalea sp. SE-J8]MDM4761921.1 hypothetical protein [Galbitalea sp. SE-J8]
MSTIVFDDQARTRKSDPLTSHLAGDRSQSTVHDVRAAVLVILALDIPEATGSQLNELYREMRADRGWPEVHFDSPRKRAGELADDGYLDVLNEDAKRGHEHVYRLKESR